MQIDFLKTFITVVETSSFTKAAKIVNLTQAAVSLQIKRLEAELGTPLFIRYSKTFKLTSSGKILLKYARKIVRNHDEAILAISNPELSGHIRFGSPEDYVSPFLSEILSRFSKTYPKVIVDVVCEYSMKLKEAVDSSELDFALCTEILDGGDVIFREPLVWISSPVHLQHQTIDPLPLAASYEGCAYRRWSIRALEQANIRHHIKYSSPTSTGTKAAVQAGFAVAVIGITNIPKDLMVIGAKENFPELPTANLALHRAPGAFNPLMLAFEKCIRKTFLEFNHTINRDPETWIKTP